MAQTHELIFITGGVRSGKSSFAEKQALELLSRSAGGELHYIATGVAVDMEMRNRINRHKQERNRGSAIWKTWEKENNIGELSSCFSKNDIILLDCLTTLLNNELFSHENEGLNRETESQIVHEIFSGIEGVLSSCGSLVLVSNEVLYEPYSKNELVFTYGRILGKLHQKLVAKSSQAYLVEAGIPVLMK